MENNNNTSQKEQIIVKNWEIFSKQILKLTDKSSKLNEFLEAIKEEFLIAPASTKTSLVCSYPGGLVEHSLRTLTLSAKLRKVYDVEKEIAPNSLILVSLLHDLGKIGNENKVYYVDQVDEWKRNKLGQNYDIAEKFMNVPVSQLSLMWLTKYGFSLDIDEWNSITSIRDYGSNNRDESVPKNGESMLSVILQQAVKVAIMKGKGKKEITLISG